MNKKESIKAKINELSALVRVSNKNLQKSQTVIGYRIARKDHFKLVMKLRKQKEKLEKIEEKE